MLHGSSNKLNFNLLYEVKELIIEYLLYSTTNFTSFDVIIRYHYVESYNLFANQPETRPVDVEFKKYTHFSTISGLSCEKYRRI